MTDAEYKLHLEARILEHQYMLAQATMNGDNTIYQINKEDMDEHMMILKKELREL